MLSHYVYFYLSRDFFIFIFFLVKFLLGSVFLSKTIVFNANPDPAVHLSADLDPVRPARMRSSFPLLEPGPPRFFWWYENSE